MSKERRGNTVYEYQSGTRNLNRSYKVDPKTGKEITGMSKENQAQSRALELEKAQLKTQQDKFKQESNKVANKAQQERDLVKGDVREGLGFAKEVLGDGSLGRINDGKNVTRDLNQTRNLRRDSLKGLDSNMMQLERDKAKEENNRATQTQLRGLRGVQASSGVRGATAGNMQANVLGQGAQRESNFERDLLLKQQGIKQQAIGDFEANTAGRLQADRGKQEFNLGQQGKEKMGQLTTAFGFGQLGVAARTGALSAEAQSKAAANSGGCFIKGTELKMKDGTWMKIEDIKMLDMTVGGLVNALSVHLIAGESIYDYMGDTFSGDHLVLVGDSFERVNTVPEAIATNIASVVYNIAVTDHVIVTRNGNLTSDLYEVDDYSVSDCEAQRMVNTRVEDIKKKYL